MTKRGKKTEIAEIRGPINGLIVEAMLRRKISNLRDFADYADISRATVYDLVRGRSTVTGSWMKPSLDTLTKMAVALDKPTHELLYLIDPDAPGANVPMAQEVVQVPVIIAGHAGAGPEQSEHSEGVTYVERSFAQGRDLSAFRIKGNSMAGGHHPIYEGDLVIVDRKQEGEINSPLVARLNSDGYICKRLRPGDMLDSANPDFLDADLAIITPDRVAEIIGKVVRTIHTDA